MEASATPAATGRGLNIAAWVASALLAALFLFAGPPKWMGAQQAVDGFRNFGFSDGFRIFIGLAETAGAIGLSSRFAFWAACGLIPIMIGAVHTHLVSGQAALVGAPLLAAAMLAFVAWVRRPQALLLASREGVKS